MSKFIKVDLKVNLEWRVTFPGHGVKLYHMAEFVHWRSTVISAYRGSLCGIYLDGVVI